MGQQIVGQPRGLRCGRLVVAVLVVAPLLVLSGASPAAAELDGPCTAEGTFRAPGVEEGPGQTVNPATTNRAEIPRDGTVEWTGTVAQPDTPRSHGGKISIDTPFTEFADFFTSKSFTQIEDWGKDEDSDVTETDFEDYEVADAVPGGAEIKVAGDHTDGTLECSGSVTLFLAGGPWGSPTTLISLAGIPIALIALALALRNGNGERGSLGYVGTVLFGLTAGLIAGILAFDSGAALAVAGLLAVLGLVAAMLTHRNDTALVGGHPHVGWIGGLVGGLLLAVLGWALGLYALDSPLLLVVPLVTMVAGFVAGLWGPWGSAQQIGSAAQVE